MALFCGDAGIRVSDTHREFVSRTLSGYMPEEIWRKAGECSWPGGGVAWGVGGVPSLPSRLHGALRWQSSQGCPDPAGGVGVHLVFRVGHLPPDICRETRVLLSRTEQVPGSYTHTHAHRHTRDRK